MTDEHLTELLERAAGRVHVGPAPVDTMVGAADRVRRRRALTLALASAAAVVAVAGGTAVLSSTGGAPGPQPPAASPTPAAPASDVRLVGLGHAAIAVPQSWGTNETRCGVPQKDTVVIDVGVIPLCLTNRPRGVDSVEVTQGKPRFDFTADETFTLDGMEAQRQGTRCAPDVGDTQVCNGTVHLPSLGVSFRAESSTSAADVDRILEQIRIADDQVGVPGYQTLSVHEQESAGEKYLDALREAGFNAEVQTKKMPGVAAGYVLGASPQPGTMLDPGAVVTVTMVAEPEGPADEVRVGMAAGEGDTALEDAQVRAGATLKVDVGDRVWAYADGNRAGTLAGELDGSSLAVDDWKQGPNYPHSWVAMAPGRTTVTLTITADGEPVVLGTVTVIVS
ncbi:PASTA domain-containing protein [Nocardioides ochotonae]|uniref:PASTA domain-containing protein n=1 Tax=Nocardioides ochotonae TaxID=2685869 RepID=UPI0014078E3B|nr:PASTA domain-containing protein [Nocardioides ochotonae]